MLKNLKVERFKSIYSADLDFGRANLIVGPNGAGKSNILEVLGILAAALSRGIDQNALGLRGVRLSLPHLFKSAFKNQRLPQSFHLVAQFEHGRYECAIRSGTSSPYLGFHSEALYDGEEKVFGRGPNGSRVYGKNSGLNRANLSNLDSNRSIWDVLGIFLDISKEFRAEIDQIADYAIYAPQTAVMRGVAIDSRVNEPLGLTGAGLAQAFQDVLAQMGKNPADRTRLMQIINIIWKPGWADNIQVRSFDESIVPPQVHSEGMLIYIRDKFMSKTRNFLSPYDASEGTLYLIFVATLLAHYDAPKMFGLDNVDGTLNPNLVRQLTDHIVNISCTKHGDRVQQQVFMTSHHPSALDSFDIFNDDHRVFTANRNDKASNPVGSTTFRAIRPPKGVSKDDWVLTHNGRNLSQLLLEGRIPGALF
ncbi:putative ATPase [Brevundimonas sp. UYEF29]|uniref:AAA family ATPase n=1 Tax=Brevundimonas sp. UYEF29 TaxID=3156346 RepID=UPI003393DEAD